MYWSPEILTGDRYTSASDMWALGVTFYQVITGEHPFNVRDEQAFKDDVTSGNVDWARLVGYERLKNILQNLLNPLSNERWDANFVLAYA
jgi:serine/threonine protein kinase